MSLCFFDFFFVYFLRRLAHKGYAIVSIFLKLFFDHENFSRVSRERVRTTQPIWLAHAMRNIATLARHLIFIYVILV